MALLNRTKTHSSAAQRRDGSEFVGAIDARGYDLHAKVPAVQQRIAKARAAWEKSYGHDPAASRVKNRP